MIMVSPGILGLSLFGGNSGFFYDEKRYRNRIIGYSGTYGQLQVFRNERN
jgi:hypothetical protein